MVAKGKKTSSKVTTVIFIIVLLTITAVLFFLVGLHWHGTIKGKIAPKKLSCWEHNDFWGTYQVDCYYPLSQKQKNFTFSDHLKCYLITNHQLSNVDENYQSGSKSVYDEISLIKADYMSFTLDFDYSNNEIKRSRDPGEPLKKPYVIIQNDEKAVNAIRKTKINDFFGYVYQYMTISKKTGKGIIAWINTEDYNPSRDSLNSEFFQCE